MESDLCNDIVNDGVDSRLFVLVGELPNVVKGLVYKGQKFPWKGSASSYKHPAPWSSLQFLGTRDNNEELWLRFSHSWGSSLLDIRTGHAIYVL